jgi:hypothetical protein
MAKRTKQAAAETPAATFTLNENIYIANVDGDHLIFDSLDDVPDGYQVGVYIRQRVGQIKTTRSLE